tara:strand:- start:47 stop:319 length:273 start_codon:yes stop_codon:yes gene_type:complete
MITEENAPPIPSDIAEHLAEDAMKLDNLNDAIIGVTTQGYLVYCYDKIVDHFVKEDGMEREEAIEYADFNVVGLDGNGNWIIVMPKYYYE